MKKSNLFLRGISLSTILVVVLFFVSCNNIVTTEDGSLSISLPGGRAVTGDVSYTVEIVNSNGDVKSKTATVGEFVYFERLRPDNYIVEVYGNKTEETDSSVEKIVYYGSGLAPVKAGKEANASITLDPVMNSYDELIKAIEKGGTVLVGSDINISSAIVIENKELNIVPVKDVVFTWTGDSGADFITVDGDGKLLLGGKNHSLTLSGGKISDIRGVVIKKGTFTLGQNATIKHCKSGGVSLIREEGGTFILDGGTITENRSSSGAGVSVNATGSFIMNSGAITKNEISANGTGGGGVYLAGGTFVMYGGSITGNTKDSTDNDLYVVSGSSFTQNGGEIGVITKSQS